MALHISPERPMSKSPIFRVVVVVAAVATAGCADVMTAPAPTVRSQKASRDTITGDSTLCHSGYIIMDGRIICREQ
jgi:hypothetical protein